VSTAQEHGVGLIRRRASNPAGSQRGHLIRGFDTGQIGAVRRREIVRRARLSGKKDSSIQRRGERRTCVRMAGKRVRIGSSRKRIARPTGFNERAQATKKGGGFQNYFKIN
jgi:hypothetical protein